MSNNIAVASSPTFSGGPNHWASSCRPFRGKTPIRLFLRKSIAILECRNEVPLHRRSPCRLSGEDSVQRARGFAGGLLCLARPGEPRSVANRDLVDDIQQVH